MRSSTSQLLVCGVVLGLASMVEAAEKAKSFSLTAQLDTNSNLYEAGAASHVASHDLTVAPSIRLNENLTLGAATIFHRDITQDQESSVKKTDLILTTSALALNPFFSIIPRLLLVTPLATNRWSEESFRGGLKAIPRLTYNLSQIGLGAVHGFYDLSLGRNFHQYDINLNGKSNIEYSIGHLVEVDVDLPAHFSLGASFRRTTGRTYHANYVNSFEIAQEIDYEVSPVLTLGVGHSNSGDVLKDNGQDSNISFFNEAQSTIYASIILTL